MTEDLNSIRAVASEGSWAAMGMQKEKATVRMMRQRIGIVRSMQQSNADIAEGRKRYIGLLLHSWR